MTMAVTGFIFDPLVVRHDPGIGHPEQPTRVSAILEKLQEGQALELLQQIPARRANADELGLVHGPGYIRLVQREVASGLRELSTGDTTISPASLDAASIAAGSVCSAVDAVFERQVSNAFCLVRPPGHHAGPNRGMGFCLFNNVGIGARYAQKRYNAERVVIVDWDVHHGNGTQEIFYRDGSVLFFSTHQSPWYPGTGARDERGEGPGAGLTLNCPLPAGSGSDEIGGAFRQILLPAIDRFEPDLILISAGFDSRIDDPLGQFKLEDQDFGQLTRLLLEAADRSAAGRVISILEGGYNLPGLASAARSHVLALAGSTA
jgi:acetoin utilization deacetylase AcuC-like enzyme